MRCRVIPALVYVLAPAVHRVRGGGQSSLSRPGLEETVVVTSTADIIVTGALSKPRRLRYHQSKSTGP